MKIIFLDIDGVIATEQSLDESGLWTFTQDCLDNLGFLLKHSKAKLVISSSWRKGTLEETKEYFISKGFPFCDEIVGVTIRAYKHIIKGIHLSIPRGVEIKQWIDVNVHTLYLPDGKKDFVRKAIGADFNYVILDDDTDMLMEQQDHFVKTDSQIGLDRESLLKAIRILNRQ